MDTPFSSPVRATAAARPLPAAFVVPAAAGSSDTTQTEILDLTAALNHHLRTPLTVLVGHSELLTTHAETLPTEQRATVHALDQAVQRLNDAVGRVCDLLREVQVRAHH